MKKENDWWQRAILASGIVFAVALLSVPAGAEAPREASVKPGINETWKSDDVDYLVGILEEEDREIYTERVNLAALAGPLPGSTVADVGAGSGFMAVEFARLVGEEGKVLAVDINPHMMKLVAERAEAEGVAERVETVVSGERSAQLPPRSVDLVFVCDTYHHFEYPRGMLRSIYEALKPGGQMVVVEFHRVEGESQPWVLEHVRAGQEVFTREIEEAGFELTNVHDVAFLERNYVLRFRRPEEKR